MPYGFLGFSLGARQQDGFFIDEENRILYWPGKDQPGYVLDEKTAVELAFTGMNGFNTGSMIGLTAVPATLYGMALLMAEIYPFLSASFSTSGAMVFLGLALMFTTIGGTVAYARYFALPQRRRLLSRGNHEVLAMPRPPCLIIKPSEAMGTWQFYSSAVVTSLLPIMFAALGFRDPPPIGDRISFVSFAVFLAAVVLFMLWQQLHGIRACNTWLYRPLASAQPQPPLSENAIPERGPLARFVRWIFSGWRGWVVAGVVAVGVGIGIAKFQEVPLTSEDLLDQYRSSAFPSQNDVALKWTQSPTVCIGPSAENDLRSGIQDAIATVAAAGNLSVEFKEANCTVNVVFLDVPRMSSDGAPDPVGGIFRHDGGVLQHVEIEVSLASLGMLDPGAVYANRHARQTLVRNVSNVVALWSIGFRGIPNLEPAYVDRQGNRLPIAQALSILHYDKSVKAGASAKDGMAQAEGLAEAVLDGTYAAVDP